MQITVWFGRKARNDASSVFTVTDIFINDGMDEIFWLVGRDVGCDHFE
jgi:hypothetical protein